MVDRGRLELAYARELCRAASGWRPDVLVSANTPLFVLRLAAPALAKAGIPLVNWLQDVHSVAMGGVLVRRLGRPGRLGAAVLRRIEADLLRSSAAVVPVTEDFLPLLREWRVPEDRVTVVRNWAELIPEPARATPSRPSTASTA